MPQKKISSSSAIISAAETSDLPLRHQISAAIKAGAATDLSTWNALLSSCLKNGSPNLALHLFDEMRRTKSTRPVNARTLFHVIAACSSLKRIKQGKQAHVWAVKDRDVSRNSHVGAALVDFYCRCGALTSAAAVYSGFRENPFATSALVGALVREGRVEEAREVYESTLRGKSLPALTFLLSGCLRGGKSTLARELLRGEMSTRLDEGFFIALIVAAAERAELRRGRELHTALVRRGLPVEGKIAAVLVEMYTKGGDFASATKVFAGASAKDLVLCNVMISGLARHGRGLQALELFERMRGGEGLPAPGKMTYLAALSGCVHAGLVAAGEKIFSEMEKGTREYAHYACMVDLYTRAGATEKAVDLLVSMPVKPDAATWGAVLRGGGEAKKMVAEEMLEMSGGDGARYVQVANAFAEAGEWHEVERVRNRMKSSRATRSHGSFSRVDVGGAAMFFGSGGNADVLVLEALVVLHNEMMTFEDSD